MTTIATGKHLQDWQTPKGLFEGLNKQYQFTIDGAATVENRQLDRCWTPQQDGLQQNWSEEVVWINPPYERGSIYSWLEKASSEHYHRNAKSVLLLPASTDTNWFREFALRGHVWLFRGRVKFVHPDEPNAQSPAFASMLVEFGFQTGGNPFLGVRDSRNGSVQVAFST